ncbi:hypothetical protein GCM10028771_09770 [Nocardioides marmoraquaticus]
MRRRLLNIERVLDALCQLGADQHADLGVGQIAQSSGVSVRSINRFFPKREQLLVAALRRQDERNADLYDPPDADGADLRDRVVLYVDRRLHLHRQMAAAVYVTASADASMHELRSTWRTHHAHTEGLTRAFFAPELERMSVAHRARALRIIDLLCQHASVDTLLKEQALDVHEARDVLRCAVGVIVEDALAASRPSELTP